MNVSGIDHIELYVGDARQAAFYYCTAFGFQIYGQGGPETGLGRTALASGLQVGDTTITITAAIGLVLEAILTFFLVNAVAMWIDSPGCETITNYTRVIQQQDRVKTVSVTTAKRPRRSTSAGFRSPDEVASNSLRGNPR